jgi:hypothetical protein
VYIHLLLQKAQGMSVSDALNRSGLVTLSHHLSIRDLHRTKAVRVTFLYQLSIRDLLSLLFTPKGRENSERIVSCRSELKRGPHPYSKKSSTHAFSKPLLVS